MRTVVRRRVWRISLARDSAMNCDVNRDISVLPDSDSPADWQDSVIVPADVPRLEP